MGDHKGGAGRGAGRIIAGQVAGNFNIVRTQQGQATRFTIRGAGQNRAELFIDQPNATGERGMGFAVNDSWARSPEFDANPNIGRDITLRAVQALRSYLSEAPNGTRLFVNAHRGDWSVQRRTQTLQSNHARRVAFFQTLGFGAPDPNGAQHGTVRAGRLVPNAG